MGSAEYLPEGNLVNDTSHVVTVSSAQLKAVPRLYHPRLVLNNLSNISFCWVRSVVFSSPHPTIFVYKKEDAFCQSARAPNSSSASEQKSHHSCLTLVSLPGPASSAICAQSFSLSSPFHSLFSELLLSSLL